MSRHGTTVYADVLRYVEEHRAGWGHSPTLAEVCRHFGFTNVSVARWFFAGLMERGLLQWQPKKARTAQATDKGRAFLRQHFGRLPEGAAS